jgi:hypothetical protein
MKFAHRLIAESARLSQQLQDNIAARAKAAVAAGTEVNLAGATKLFTTVTDLITKNKTPITELLSESSSTVMTSIFVRDYVHTRYHSIYFNFSGH